MKKLRDTDKPGAFLNLYQPIGADCFGVKSLEIPWDLYADHAYILRACEWCRRTDNKHSYVSLDEMYNEAQREINRLYSILRSE